MAAYTHKKGFLTRKLKGSDEFFNGQLKPAGSLLCDKGPSQRRGPLSHGKDPARF